MDRRAFISAGVALGAAWSPTARAADQIVGMTAYGPVHRAYVTRPQRVVQHCPLWCWAASSAMIFDSYGHTIDQQDIVGAVFGNPNVCMNAFNAAIIPSVLSSNWTDVVGNSFQSTVTAAYDPMNGVVAIDNNIIIDTLVSGNPLLYCNRHHAMVVVAADYYPTTPEPTVIAVGVLDPWPAAPGFHPLSQSEMTPVHMGGDMAFLATVDVS